MSSLCNICGLNFKEKWQLRDHNQKVHDTRVLKCNICDDFEAIGQGKLDANKLWKFRKKMCPNSRDPPTAMMDKHGNILISDDAISNRALEVYSERLSNNKIPSHFAEYEKDVNTLCEIRLKI